MRLAAAALVLVVLALAPHAAAAQSDGGWEILRFHADIRVARDASLTVVESIDVDFRSLQRRGIFREIPVRYAYGERHERVYDLDVARVTDAAGRAWPHKVERNGANLRIRVGDPDVYLTGRQSYRITYRVAGALNAFPTHDELFWNVSGNDWPVPIRELGALVRLETGQPLERVACFEGPAGSTAPCRAQRSGAQATFASGGPARAGEGLTVVVGLPKGAVAEPAPILRERPRGPDRWFEVTPATVGASALVLALGLALVARSWWRRGRDRRYIARSAEPGGAERPAPLFDAPTIVTEYEPPERLRPAEIGLLIDERADMHDLTATIVDLAVRGHLRIEHVPKEGLFGGDDWRLVRTGTATAGLDGYEATLLDAIFARGGPSVLLSGLKGETAPALEKARRQLYEGATGRGWFAADPERARQLALGIGVLVVVAGAGLVFLLGTGAGFGLVGLALAAVGLAVVALHGAMARRSARGSELLRRVLGFRRYIDTAERHRAEFAEREGIFASFLPYAIVFGLVERWAAAFRGLDREAAAATAAWYAGPEPFSAASFSSGLADFSSSVSGTIGHTPSSSGSSGFSGGSSGGGGGGGGGGSW